MSAELERRVARLEAIEAIKRVQIRYAEICDAGNDPDEHVKLFVEDAVWDSGERFGVHRGVGEIHAFFSGIRNVMKWALHYMISPVVEVADDLKSARGHWYLWQPCTMEIDGVDEPVFLTATYDVDYVLDDDGAWKFKEVRLRVQTLAPYADGWVKTPFIGA
jgi:hypothetical protein